MNEITLLATGAAVLLGWGILIFAIASRQRTNIYGDDDYDSTLCAPSRRANITASVPHSQRRVLGPPAGWHEPVHVAIVPAPVEVDDLDDWDDGDELPLVVEDWPTPVVVAPAPVPVVANRTAARFANLELRGGAK
jgi:hypothetical protein